ncbi:MAG: hypothetical protein V7K97_01675 [Nostoc sp.]
MQRRDFINAIASTSGMHPIPTLIPIRYKEAPNQKSLLSVLQAFF